MENDKNAKNSEKIRAGEEEMLNRRDLLNGLGKWSKIVIGVAIFGGALIGADRDANAWINRGGGGAGWVNRGGGSAAWANRGGGWANRGGSWINRY